MIIVADEMSHSGLKIEAIFIKPNILTLSIVGSFGENPPWYEY